MVYEISDAVQTLIQPESIRPFREYVEPHSWTLVGERFERDFVGKKGVYCFWWHGPRTVLANGKNEISFNGRHYELNCRKELQHDLVPMYVGMTANAGTRVGNRYSGRIVDRFMRFPKIFSAYTNRRTMSLVKAKTGTCGNFDLFEFPERIRYDISVEINNPEVSIHEVETHILVYDEIRKMYETEYKNIYINNYSVSFSPLESDVDIFYAEALAIGYLEPWLNKS